MFNEIHVLKRAEHSIARLSLKSIAGERFANKCYTVVSATFSFSSMTGLEITIGIATLCWVPRVFIKFQDRSSLNHQRLIICQFYRGSYGYFSQNSAQHDSKGKKAVYRVLVLVRLKQIIFKAGLAN